MTLRIVISSEVTEATLLEWIKERRVRGRTTKNLAIIFLYRYRKISRMFCLVKGRE